MLADHVAAKGRLVVISGAGSGLGRALARRLAADGDTIILLGRTLAKLEAVAAELGPRSHPVVCDVANAQSVRAAFAEIAERSPRIDVLINNAAIYQPTLVKDAKDLQIEAAVTTNFAGPIYCSRAAIPMMGRGGHILNISSETVGLPHAMFSLYQSSKAGLERFSEALRAELEPDGIRVTMVRAGQMTDEESTAPSADPEVLRRFAEENLKRGLDFRQRPISTFGSVADLIRALTHLPDDLNVPQIVLEARRP
ncbi:SDR family NAD(P)-dependent oxidoreductase [Phenylobacterium sp. LjRoot225]|uniref:SDR family oxidoreductase n=1 Tax=Phenylobacterium sp. LjRoot225 TaxID=3342285 RepID=UPI003ECFA534